MHFVKTCCTLRVKTLIIGSISLVCSAASLIFIIANIPVILHYTTNNAHGIIKHENTTRKFLSSSDVRVTNSSNIDEGNPSTVDNDDLVEKNATLYEIIDRQLIFTGKKDTYIVIPYLVGDTISLVSSILLIVGALKRNKWLLLPWIAYTSLSVIVGILASVYSQIIISHYVSGTTILLAVLCIVLGLALYLYMLSVVIRHFEELRKADKERFYDPGKIYSPWASPAISMLSYPPERDAYPISG